MLFNANSILIAAAVIPAVFLALRVYRADKFEKEPPMLLLSLVLYGMIATAVALVAESIGIRMLDEAMEENSLKYRLILYFVVVGCSEEGAKYILLKWRTWKNPAFDCKFDGVVYAVFVSLGFALWENIKYVFTYGLGTAMLRAVTAVPGHACFGVFMGTWYGLAKKYEHNNQPAISRICRLMSLLFAVLMHGCYDFVASINNRNYAWIFWVFIIVMFIIAWALIKHESDNDEFIS